MEPERIETAGTLDARPSVLLLDALGTLLALKPPAPLLRSVLLERFGIEVTQAQAQRAIAAEIAFYRAHLQEGRDAASLQALRRRCAQALRSALPPRASIAALDCQGLTDALLASLKFSAFADARPAIAAARERGARVIVVSNWDVSLETVLARLGLAQILDGVVTSAGVGARKPSAAIFRHALALAGASAQDAVHVGDSLEEDVMGARAAGIEPILIRRDGSSGPPGVRTVATLARLGHS